MAKSAADMLPPWAARRKDGVFIVDADAAYKAILKELKVKPADYDQYWLEVAFQCMKLEIQRTIGGTRFDPRSRDVPTALCISIAGGKEKWALNKFPPGRGIWLATKGKEARGHYLRLRGGIPA